jgi:hypothetical protein
MCSINKHRWGAELLSDEYSNVGKVLLVVAVDKYVLLLFGVFIV